MTSYDLFVLTNVLLFIQTEADPESLGRGTTAGRTSLWVERRLCALGMAQHSLTLSFSASQFGDSLREYTAQAQVLGQIYRTAPSEMGGHPRLPRPRSPSAQAYRLCLPIFCQSPEIGPCLFSPS